jgi:hypothetical protein
VNVFLDTSAFAKRYVDERGSDKVVALCQRADNLAVSVICLLELVSTLSRLVREKKPFCRGTTSRKRTALQPARFWLKSIARVDKAAATVALTPSVAASSCFSTPRNRELETYD